MSRGKWLSRQQKDTVLKLALEDLAQVEIAKVVGCSANSISQMLTASGVATEARTARAKRRPKGKHKTERIVATYQIEAAEISQPYRCIVRSDLLLQRLQAGLR